MKFRIFNLYLFAFLALSFIQLKSQVFDKLDQAYKNGILSAGEIKKISLAFLKMKKLY
jgi:hypothetical protein